jgi:hypothetical protein
MRGTVTIGLHNAILASWLRASIVNTVNIGVMCPILIARSEYDD